ncbi:MAG: hypothetical protein JNM72_15085 [Deltaproteobacteria bacterium]|nr:hypothetical protein [Deltaproteobacteria bacterium]
MISAPSSSPSFAPVRAGLALLSLLGLAAGCTALPSAKTCESNSECGSNEACIDGACAEVQCRTNDHCAIKHYCTDKGECAPGCAGDDDCFAGQTCDLATNTCERRGCRDTQLDCGYNEFCDQTTGECVPSGLDVCSSCNPEAASCGGGGACFPSEEQGTCSASFTCPSGQGCFIAEYDDRRTCEDWIGLPDDSVCASGWVCGQISASSPLYCLRPACFTGECYVGCDSSDEDPCPRGFDCVDAGTGDEVCFADCAYLRENDHL